MNSCNYSISLSWTNYSSKTLSNYLLRTLASFSLAGMENYSYTSYPESGDSSPRSREIEFENPPPWDDQQQPNTNTNNNTYKVKFMCSYNGKIQPRPHDNQLSYVGGETKILTVDRNIKFSLLLSKLSTLCDSHVCFKYQLPGEDLDALISVTNDDDLEHMMHEYDRLSRPSNKPARLRLFFFATNPPPPPSNQSSTTTDQFVDALDSAPINPPVSPSPVDLLIGLDKGKPETEIQVPKHIQDLQRLRIGEEQAVYRRKSDDNLAAAFSGDLFTKMPEKVSPVPNYWPENQVTRVFQATTRGPDQQVYMIPPQGGVYHAPMAIPMTGPAGQGYYTVQRMAPEVYREQPVYAQSGVPQPTLPPQMVMPGTTGGVDTGYTQMAYDSVMGRQVYYTTPGGAVGQVAQPTASAVQYQAMGAPIAYGADMRPAGNFNQLQEGGKVVPEASM